MEIWRSRGLISITLAITCIIAAGFPTTAQDVIKVQTELVNLNVVVRDHQGKRVSGLRKEDFEIFEDDSRQEITHFSAEEVPLRLVLVFDLSLSMEAVLPTVKQGAFTLLGSLRDDDDVSVVAFATDVHQFSGWIKKDRARDIIDKLEAEPHPQPTTNLMGRGYRVGDANTFLFEAFQHCFTHFEGSDDRVAIIMFTDLVDTAAGRDVRKVKQRVDEMGKEVMQQAQESWGLVYPIRYKTEQIIGALPKPSIFSGPVIHIGGPPPDPTKGVFEKITAASGGEIFDWTTSADLLVAVGNVLADLRSQYSLGYRPPAKDETAFRHLKVRVKRPNLAVRTREGYIHRPQSRPRRATSP
ncbi:MAG TPA: VWA domain-containing protein [Pyrinomonadaceae bacterium]|nr:VWA domain-containing protein [Pyrinomonadaceae bacterium]